MVEIIKKIINRIKINRKKLNHNRKIDEHKYEFYANNNIR